MKEECCQKCRYWRQKIDKRGECHRYAPRPQLVEKELDNLWASTYSEEWCGEFENKKIKELKQ